MNRFLQRLHAPRPLLLDGATGTELTRRGYALQSPAWSASALVQAPELLLEIHRDYVKAGAEILTANTFRTHRRSLQEAGWEDHSAELTRLAVDLARTAGGPATLIAGSVAPLEDCYSPHLTPSSDELEAEHAEHVRHLAESGVDLLLVETQITLREAQLATQAAIATHLPVWVSFTLAPRVLGMSPCLLSGDSFQEAVQTVLDLGAVGISVNCVPTAEVLPALSACPPGVSLGAYANTGRMLADGSWSDTKAVNPAVYAVEANSWKEAGLRLIGGCCGTTPQHISRISEMLYGIIRESESIV